MKLGNIISSSQDNDYFSKYSKTYGLRLPMNQTINNNLEMNFRISLWRRINTMSASVMRETIQISL